MFKFGFGEDNLSEDKSVEVKKKLEWFPVCEINPTIRDAESFTKDDDFIEKELFSNVTMKLIKNDYAITKLKNEKCNYILEAESQHSDLVPSKYEGGLKIWECTFDLGNYILEKNYSFPDKLVLDLGCGVGVIGLLAMKYGAKVHFQDYNTEIIKYITITNVEINYGANALEKCKFYSGDWESFTNMLSEKYSENEKYDYIFTSETIYNLDNHGKLLNVFKCRLKKTGVGLVAAKSHYFGVGGGMRQFETLVKKDEKLDAKIVRTCDEGLTREILEITWNV